MPPDRLKNRRKHREALTTVNLATNLIGSAGACMDHVHLELLDNHPSEGYSALDAVPL
ncbi:MAG: hypothetical protein AVDCRST_MAG93-5812 [uncultured Chloroflexia bacterium]|uniref:Uncharacterized protein n=1 Tax=uncultured Chloroflexia bacterium TaxID=1672391 RepID=A0A6J4L4S7_9CHLR|nr:MAG: hypothetical protein AVDCRST_MAG93-5812 [uncultured Chloroflexia bacterium]